MGQQEPTPNVGMLPVVQKSQTCEVNRAVWERKYPGAVSVAPRRKGLFSFQIPSNSPSSVRNQGQNFKQPVMYHPKSRTERNKCIYSCFLVCTVLGFFISIQFRTLCLGMVPSTVGYVFLHQITLDNLPQTGQLNVRQSLGETLSS